MDPITHTLVGASLAATRLGQTTRRAVPALVIGANLPDIDVLSYFGGSDAALGFRRGWTHGVLALVVLPALLAALLWAWERRRSHDERPLSGRWLIALSYLAVLTHPFLDWLNTYGMRWLMPFDDTWFYGDAVFIMDPWLWLVLGVGWLIGQRPSRRWMIAWAVVGALLLALVARRAPDYAPIVGAVFVVLLLALLWKPASVRRKRQAAAAGLAVATLFIGCMIAIHEVTERRVMRELERAGLPEVEQLMVGPLPANPSTWEFVVRANGHLRHGRIDWFGEREISFSPFQATDARDSALWEDVERTGQIPGFLHWARFPWLPPTPPNSQGIVWLLDARYARDLGAGFGSAAVILPSASGSP